jgi:drug/metabolite transporter (DMT)-like permease
MLNLFEQQLPKRTAMIVILASSSLWGLLWLPLRYIDNLGLSGIWTNAYIALLPIPLLLWLHARQVWNDRINHKIYFWAGLAIGLGFMLYTFGLIVGSVTKTTLLFYLTPVWSSLLGMIFLQEKPRPILWLGNAIGLIGCALVLNLSLSSTEIEAVDLLGFMSGVFWAIGSVIIRRYPKVKYTGITLVQYLASLIIAAAIIIITDLPIPPASAFVSSLPMTAFVSLGIILPTLVLIFRITQYISPAVVGILMLSEVFAAIISASIFLDEHISALQWLGAGLIVVTAIMITLSESATDNSDD